MNDNRIEGEVETKLPEIEPKPKTIREQRWIEKQRLDADWDELKEEWRDWQYQHPVKHCFCLLIGWVVFIVLIVVLVGLM